MFESTGWDLCEKGKYPKVTSENKEDYLLIVKRFEFDHARQTMSVIVKDSKNNLHVYVK
eukprot:Pgem_evm1s9375